MHPHERLLSKSGTLKTQLRVAPLGLAIVAALWPFATWHLSRTGFWYDESMQFWMSLGLDGFGPPLEPRGTLGDVLKQNAIANLDPGGFSLLLNLWTDYGTSGPWQRTLPLLFFAAGMVGLGMLAWTWRRSIPFAFAAGLVPVLYPILLDYSAEVRAYSMEFAGVVIGCLMLARLLKKPRIRSALLAGIVMGFFMTSRYSYALFAAAAFLTLAIAWRHRRSVLVLLAAFAVPLAISGALILFLTFLPQYQARIAYQGGAFLEYFRFATATGKSAGEIAAKAAANLLMPAGLPISILAFFGVLALAPASWRRRIGVGSISPATASFGVLALAVLVLTVLVWPWHPWDMKIKWSIWLNALSAVAVVRLTAGLLEYAGSPDESGWEARRWITVGLLTVFVAFDLRLAFYRQPEGNTVVPALRYLEGVEPSASLVAVDHYWYPTVRYWYEYGSFAGSRLYPSSFRLPYWNGPDPLVSPPQTRFLITPRSFEDAKAGFSHAKIVADPSLPRHLFRVEPAADPSP